MTTQTLSLLGYCIASAYVLVPAMFLIVCAALARLEVRIPELSEPEAKLHAQRDAYAYGALDALHAYASAVAAGDMRAATYAAAMAFWYKRRAEMLDELLAAFV